MEYILHSRTGNSQVGTTGHFIHSKLLVPILNFFDPHALLFLPLSCWFLRHRCFVLGVEPEGHRSGNASIRENFLAGRCFGGNIKDTFLYMYDISCYQQGLFLKNFISLMRNHLMVSYMAWLLGEFWLHISWSQRPNFNVILWLAFPGFVRMFCVQRFPAMMIALYVV